MQAFEWVFRYKPVQIEIMNGSLDHAGKSAALVFFVHVDNPLTELTPSQLAAVLGGGPDAIRTWGGLGMHGEWSGRRINLYLPDLTSGTGKFLQEALLNGKKTMTWDHLKEFSDREKFQSPTHDAGAQIITALVDDRFGLGLASAAFSSARVRPLALRVAASEPPVSATRDSIVAGHYPLARVAVACVNRPPGATLDPMVREFITYILSEEGQRVAEQNGYLSLAENHRSDQRRKL
jgi:phosphate transport system substrate-binding protein